MTSHDLEQRWALYDSNRLEEFLNKNPGDLTYFRGDLIQVLERTNEHWALGLCRHSLGVFPLQQTTPSPFVQALTNYTARDATEISFVKGDIMPAAPSSDPARYTLFRDTEYGLGPRIHFTTVGRTPSVEERRSNPSRYNQFLKLEKNQIRLVYITPENIEQFIASGKQSLFITIQHASLEEVKGAVALSYCWGDQMIKKPFSPTESFSTYLPRSGEQSDGNTLRVAVVPTLCQTVLKTTDRELQSSGRMLSASIRTMWSKRISRYP
jgi:hypothetical protein